MATYVWSDKGFVDKRSGEAMTIPDRNGEICVPQVMRDIDEYLSPCGTGLITSRSSRREDLKRNNCVEAPPRKRRGFKNPRFAAKHGLPLHKD